MTTKRQNLPARRLASRAAMMLLLCVLTATTAWAQSTSNFNQNSLGEWVIWNNTGWNDFCNAIENGSSFDGETVKLGNTISTSRMAGSEAHKFKGTFDGQNKVLNFLYTGSEGEEYIAPFKVVSDNATFRNLYITGDITSSGNYAAGLIGCLYSTITIENCASHINITGTGSCLGGFVGLCKYSVSFTNCKSNATIKSSGGNNGGFVGYSWSSTGHSMNFTGCVFTGKLLQYNGNGASNGGFIGWKGADQTVTLTNCLCTPAAPASGETLADNSSSTFVRGWNASTSATNSYYTTAFGTAQCKQARSIEAGENVTVANTGSTTTYATFADFTAYTTGIKYNNVLYAGYEDQVSLNLGSTVNPPSGFQYNYNASGGTLSGSSNPYTLTMPDANVTITSTLSSTHQPISVSYIAADGTTQTANAIALDGTETDLGSYGQTTWYVVNNDISHTGQIICKGYVNLILADSKTMTVTTSGNDNAFYSSAPSTLTIYGQTLGSGTLNAISTNSHAISVNTYTQHGGQVTVNCSSRGIDAKYMTISGGQVTTNGNLSYGLYSYYDLTISDGTINATGYYGSIYSDQGNITISGGNVTADGYTGINAYSGSITLGWTNTTDRIYASTYIANHTISIANGKYFKDANSGNVYCGNVGNSINRKTLTPATQAEYINYAFTQNVSGSGTSQSPYVISTTAGWNALCDMIEIGETFGGKYLKLGASISVSRMAGIYSTTDNNNRHAFSGTFNGQNNNGQNNTLTFNCTAASSNYVAPFGYVKGGNSANSAITICNLNVVTTITAEDYRHMGGLIALQEGHVNVTDCNANVTLSATKGTNNPSDLYPAGLVSQVSSSNNGTLTISGCTTTGTIATDGKYAAGMVGIVQGSASITNSVSSVTINSSTAGDGTHGGFVAVSYPGSSTIEGCLFNGKLLTVNTGETTSTKNCGGFVGWKSSGTVTISNSLYAPAALTNGQTEVKFDETESHPNATFVRNGNANLITTCYFTRTLGTAQGKQARSITAGENVTIEAISPIGDATATYSVSGITAYAKGITRTVGETTTFYYGNEDQVSLTLQNSATAPLGYHSDYTVNADATLSDSGNPYTLTMPDADVTINVVTPPNTYYVHFDGNGNTGGSMGDQTFTYDEAQTLIANAFTRTNHTFTGWSTTSNGEVEYTDGQSVSNLTATNGETVTLYAQWTITPIPYIDQNGVEQQCTDYTVITEGEGHLSTDHLEAGQWYVFGDNLNAYIYTLNVNGSGAANIILVDGKTYKLEGHFGNSVINGSVNIYAQSLGTGRLELKGGDSNASLEKNGRSAIQGDITLYGGTITATGGDISGSNTDVSFVCGNGIDGSVTIYGGSLTAQGGNPNGHYHTGSHGISGNVTFYGGSLTAKGNNIYVENDLETFDGINGYVTLSWSNATDRFYTSSIGWGTVTIAQGKAFTDGTNIYSGTCTQSQTDALAGKTLQPVPAIVLADNANNTSVIAASTGSGKDVMLYGRTLYKDGDWNTLCLPFDIDDFTDTPLEGATMMKLGNSDACNTGFDASTGTLSLDFVEANTIEAGHAYIVKWTTTGANIVNPVFTGVTIENEDPADQRVVSQDGYVEFVGTYSPTDIYTAEKTNLYLGANNKLYYPWGEDMTEFNINSFRAYFQLKNGLTAGNPALSRIALNFGDGEASGITTTDYTDSTDSDDSWYTVNGVKLDKKPTKAGLYINNGRKVVMK